MSTSRRNSTDNLIWSIPQIIRSILTPDQNALAFLDPPAALCRGDIICLGTPGGVVITAKPQAQFAILNALLFWWTPRDWHDAFFARDHGYYLNTGDEVFFWAEGLGFQRGRVEREEE